MTTNLPTLIPVSEMTVMAEAVAKSKLFGISKTEEAMALMLIAQAEGQHPAIAIRDYHIIQGKPALKADAMLARFQSAGGRVVWKEMSDQRVAAEFSHPSGGTVLIDWDMNRAKAAQLGGKDMWKKFPRQMLRARVISEGIRSVFPGVIVGSYTPEEVQDFDAPPPPKQQPQTPPAAQQGKVIEGEVIKDGPATNKAPPLHNDVKPGTFSMAGEHDPNNPFKTGDERRQWLTEAKAALDDVSLKDELDEWLSTYGQNLKWLGNMQFKRMNEEIEEARIRVMEREMDQQAANRA